MPLKEGKSKKVMEDNMKELFNSNNAKPEDKKRSREQILAIVYSKAGKSRKKKK